MAYKSAKAKQLMVAQGIDVESMKWASNWQAKLDREVSIAMQVYVDDTEHYTRSLEKAKHYARLSNWFRNWWDR